MGLKKILEKQGRRFSDSIKKTKGRFGELAFETVMKTRGKNPKRTGIGSDYRIGKHLYEVKMDSSRPSPKQKRMKRRHGKRYHIVHYGYGGKR